MKNYFYINGNIVPDKDAYISPSDRGFLLGDGLFETILAVEGVPLFLESHLTRLKKGLTAILFEPSSTQRLFKDIKDGVITRLIKKNGLSKKQARIRITISRGTGSGGLAPSSDASPTVIISTSPVDIKKIERKVTLGIAAITIKGLRPALPGVKSLNFMPNILGAARAKNAGAEEGFFLAPDTRTVLEGTSSNIFIFTEGRLLSTPAATEIEGPGVLAGVVRQFVLEQAKKMKVLTKECWFTVADIMAAEEVFITNSISGVVPVIRVDSRGIGDGKIGEITKGFQKEYNKKISAFF